MVALYFSHKVHNSCSTSTEKANSILVVSHFFYRFYFKINLFFFSNYKKSPHRQKTIELKNNSPLHEIMHIHICKSWPSTKIILRMRKTPFFFFFFFWTGKSRSIFPNLSSAPILCSKSDFIALKIVVWCVIQGDFSSILDNWQGSNLN